MTYTGPTKAQNWVSENVTFKNRLTETIVPATTHLHRLGTKPFRHLDCLFLQCGGKGKKMTKTESDCEVEAQLFLLLVI